jgi:histidinol-phosphate/aromatic aminotransferase/cobyric acid decarboxylase-like protein
MESLRQIIPLVDLHAQYRQLKPEIDTAIAKVLEECAFILGPAVDEFERRFADYIGVRHAVGVSSGLDALRLALTALNVGPGDEVLVPPIPSSPPHWQLPPWAPARSSWTATREPTRLIPLFSKNQ